MYCKYHKVNLTEQPIKITTEQTTKKEKSSCLINSILKVVMKNECYEKKYLNQIKDIIDLSNEMGLNCELITEIYYDDYFNDLFVYDLFRDINNEKKTEEEKKRIRSKFTEENLNDFCLLYIVAYIYYKKIIHFFIFEKNNFFSVKDEKKIKFNKLFYFISLCLSHYYIIDGIGLSDLKKIYSALDIENIMTNFENEIEKPNLKDIIFTIIENVFEWKIEL